MCASQRDLHFIPSHTQSPHKWIFHQPCGMQWHAISFSAFSFPFNVSQIAKDKIKLTCLHIFHHFVSRTFLFGLTAFVYFVYNLFTSYSLIYLIFHHGTQIQNKIRLNHCHSPTFSFLSFILLFSGAFFRSFGNCFGCEHH